MGVDDDDETFSGEITGAGSLTKVGSGILTLTGDLSYTDETVLEDGGDLRLSGDNGGMTGPITVTDEADLWAGEGNSLSADTRVTLDSADAGLVFNTGTAEDFGSLAGSGTVDIHAAEAGVGQDDTDTTFSGFFYGEECALSKLGSGTLTLSGTNQHTCGAILRGGVLSVFEDANLGRSDGVLTFDGGGLRATGAGTLSMGRGVSVSSSGGAVEVSAAGGTLRMSGAITGSGDLTKRGAGAWSLRGSNGDYSGDLIVAEGTLAAGISNSLGEDTAVSLAEGAVLSLEGAEDFGALVGAGAVHTQGYDLGVGQDGTDRLFEGPIDGGGALIKLGAGALTLRGANTYGGGTTVSSGALIGDTGSLQGDIAVAGTLRFEQASDGVFSDRLSGDGDVIKEGEARLSLTGSNSGFGGDLRVERGTLGAGIGNSLGAATLVSVAEGAVFELEGGEAFGALEGAGLIDTQGFDLGVGGDGRSTVVSGPILGAGHLSKQGSGTLTLSGANTLSGGVTVEAGALRLSGDNAAMTAPIEVTGGALIAGLDDSLCDAARVTLAAGTRFVLEGDEGFGSLAGAGETDTAGRKLDLGHDDSDSTYAGVIGGSGRLVKAGAGAMTLTGANTYTGGTTIQAGSLAVSSASLPGDVVNEATLRFDQASDGVMDGVISGSGQIQKHGAGALTLGGDNTYSGGTLVAEGALVVTHHTLPGDVTDDATLRFVQATSGTFPWVISGSGALEKQGAGRLILTASNTFSGGTTVSDGALQVHAASLSYVAGDGNDLGITASDPNLAVSKSSDLTDPAVAGAPWTWTLAVTNGGQATARFADGEAVLRDDLPPGLACGAPAVSASEGLTGTVSCAIEADSLRCVADGEVRLAPPSGRLEIAFTATAATPGVYANPHGGGACAVDPDGHVDELYEDDNACAHAVVVGEDCNDNGVADVTDLGAGTSLDLNTDGIPDECQTDYGDAPESYGTRLAEDGARHLVDGLLSLGAIVDVEQGGLPSADATGDDADQSPDDEDGVTVTTPLVPGAPVSLEIVASAEGALNAWLDEGRDGVFDPGDRIFTDQPLVAGANTLFFTLAGGAVEGETFARFRLSADAGQVSAPTGVAIGGEVEDYAVTVDADPDDDDDGVLDLIDACPDTPQGTTVSTKGCPCDEVSVDATCDGVDDDCDLALDEDYAPEATSCGIGACVAAGATSCVAGVVVDDCAAGAPAADDATCDGVDDDCDGVTDNDGALACDDGDPCTDDGDCGVAGNLCVSLPSGDYCGVDCSAEGATCPEGTTCADVEDGARQCLPEAGDCACTPHAVEACVDGALVSVDSCGQVEEVLDDCGERGCVDQACCLEGTHEADGACAPDAAEGEDQPEVVEPDAIEPDTAQPDTAQPDTAQPDADKDALPPPDEVDGDGLDVVPDEDAAGADEDSGGGGGSDCAVGPRPSAGAPWVLLLALVALVRRRRGSSEAGGS